MSAVDGIDSARERALASVRAAFLAAATDHQAMRIEDFGVDHSEPLTVSKFRSFAETVWSGEGRTEHLKVSEVEWLPARLHTMYTDAAAANRWSTVPAWFGDTGFGGPRLVAFIDVKVEGLRRLIALHEVAHLLVDSETMVYGHGPQWVAAYRDLIQTYLPPVVYAIWDLVFRGMSSKAEERVAADPLWLAHLV